MKMLDTNICIYLMKRKYESVSEKFNEEIQNQREVYISSITLAELEHGVQKSDCPEKNQLALLQFLAGVTILYFDDSAAIEYGKIRAYLEKRGTPIGIMDMLIAAHARVNGLTLVTNNTREFERVPNLDLENWV